jgi:tRNA threonylcarbamoyladenosine biosynthesis protein TsaE
MTNFCTNLHTLEHTQQLAKKIARVIIPNFTISLKGNLGAGKTTLVREILRALGETGAVKSPTFTLVEPYVVNGLNIHHFDLYRFNDPEEWISSGFDEYFGPNNICFIEWAEKAEGLIPSIDWEISLELLPKDDDLRKLTIRSLTPKGIQCLTQLMTNAAV